VEIFQNCIVYNDDVFAPFTAKEHAGKQLWLEAASRCCSPAASAA
jgi:2-oxoglutarate ferredoxin oxidoreductase subunit beta